MKARSTTKEIEISAEAYFDLAADNPDEYCCGDVTCVCPRCRLAKVNEESAAIHEDPQR